MRRNFLIFLSYFMSTFSFSYLYFLIIYLKEKARKCRKQHKNLRKVGVLRAGYEERDGAVHEEFSGALSSFFYLSLSILGGNERVGEVGEGRGNRGNGGNRGNRGNGRERGVSRLKPWASVWSRSSFLARSTPLSPFHSWGI
jgi:hypothetical protein